MPDSKVTAIMLHLFFLFMFFYFQKIISKSQMQINTHLCHSPATIWPSHEPDLNTSSLSLCSLRGTAMTSLKTELTCCRGLTAAKKKNKNLHPSTINMSAELRNHSEDVSQLFDASTFWHRLQVTSGFVHCVAHKYDRGWAVRDVLSSNSPRRT